MSMDPDRLKTAIYNLTKTELKSRFDSFKTGLLPTEQTGFDAALDKLAMSIGYGDGPETYGEITTNGRVTEGIQVTLTPSPATVTKGFIE